MDRESTRGDRDGDRRRPPHAGRRRRHGGDRRRATPRRAVASPRRRGALARGDDRAREPVGRSSRRRQRLRQRSRLDGGPGPWDAACGFSTAAEAAVRARRGPACVPTARGGGVEAVRGLRVRAGRRRRRPLGGLGGRGRSGGDGADARISLAAPDHLRLTRLLLARPLPGVRAGLYVEQPYATWRLIGRGRRTGAQGLTPSQGLRNLFLITFRTRAGRRLQAPRIPPVLSNGSARSPGSRSDVAEGLVAQAASDSRLQVSGRRLWAARHLADGRLRGRMGRGGHRMASLLVSRPVALGGPQVA